MYKVKRFSQNRSRYIPRDPDKHDFKLIKQSLMKGDDGKYYDEFHYRKESTGETAVRRKPLPDNWADDDMKWLSQMTAKKKPSVKRYSLARRFHDAKKVYKGTLEHAEETAKGYEDSANRTMELKMNGYNNLPVHKSNPNYINKLKAEGTYESTEKKWRKSVDKMIKSDRKTAENLRKRPKIEAFKQAVNAFKSKDFSKQDSEKKEGFGKLKSGLFKVATRLGKSDLNSAGYRKNPKSHLHDIAVSQHLNMMNEHLAAHNQMTNTAMMHHQMHMGMFSDRSFSLKSRFDSAKRSYKNSLKYNNEILEGSREAAEFVKNRIESGEAKRDFDELMKDPYYKDDKFRDERERNYMKSERKVLKGIQKDIKMRENHPKTLALKNAVSSFLRND